MGYASTFGLTVVAVESPPPMAAAGPTCVPVPLALNRRGSVSTMLGVIDAHVAVSAEQRVLGARIAGDVIADPAGIAALEAGLVGCPAAASSVQAVVDRVYADPNHFLLGIGPTATLTDAIMRAVSG